MSLQVTDEQVVISNGGHKEPGYGHHSTHPIWRDSETHEEFISLDGETFVKLEHTGHLKHVRRELRHGK